MSRQQANKSRGDKGASRGGGGAASVTIPAVSNDVVPGRMTVADWGKISATDDDDEFVANLVEEIVESTLDKCYEKFIAKKVLPFTIFKAKDDLLSIIQWRFLSHDIGEEDIAKNQGWAEDAEPEPGIIDSWAQGSVPIIFKKEPEPIIQHVVEEPEKIDDDLETDNGSATETISFGTGLGTQEPEDIKPERASKDENVDKSDAKPVKRKIKYKKHTGRLPSAHVGDMDQTLEHSESQLFARELSDLQLEKDPGAHLSPSQRSFLKLQAGRPPGNKEVTFDEKGNVVAVMKLDTRSLPTHKVRVSYSIVDPEAEAAAQRLEAMRTGKLRQLAQIQWKPKPRRTRISPRPPIDGQPDDDTKPTHPVPPLHRRNMQIAGKTRGMSQGINRSQMQSRYLQMPRRKGEDDPNIEPLPSSLIDSIDASPGVVITEGDQVKAGAKSKSLGPLVHAPVLSDDGTIIGSVTVSTKGNRTLRFLGAAPASSSGMSDVGIRPLLSPSRVIGNSEPHVSSPFSITQPIQPPMSSNSVTSS